MALGNYTLLPADSDGILKSFEEQYTGTSRIRVNSRCANDSSMAILSLVVALDQATVPPLMSFNSRVIFFCSTAAYELAQAEEVNSRTRESTC